jgi:hypothetical protein
MYAKVISIHRQLPVSRRIKASVDGQLWVATRLPSTHSGSFTFGMPGAIKRYLAGRQFAVKDDDGIDYGSIRVNDEGSSYGFSSFLRQRGADEGDILIAEFDLNGGTALFRLETTIYWKRSVLRRNFIMRRSFKPHDFEADIMSIENDDSGRRNPETWIDDGVKCALVGLATPALERIAFGGS